MKPSGWRKPTPGLALAERHAQAGEQGTVSKGRALPAVKRVGVHLGLKAGDILLLDMLGAFTQERDWEPGHRPIVWPSNACLMARTGFSLSALKRRLRKLGEAGLVAFVDGSNGKRWGRRDAEGYITEACGIDLGPLRARAVEFEHLERRIQAEAELRLRLRRRITIARRMARARIEAALDEGLAGPWERLRAVHGWLVGKLPRNRTTREGLEALATRWSSFERLIEKLVGLNRDTNLQSARSGGESHDPDPREASADPHIPTTNEHESVSSKKEGQDFPSMHDPAHSPMTRNSFDTKEPRTSLAMVLATCPEFISWARNISGEPRNWAEAHHAAGVLAPMIGVSTEIWAYAQKTLGLTEATAALALVFEKACSGAVRAPGRYIVGMLRRSLTGDLHLHRSFRGRMASC